jgi:hypothetical protein
MVWVVVAAAFLSVFALILLRSQSRWREGWARLAQERGLRIDDPVPRRYAADADIDGVPVRIEVIRLGGRTFTRLRGRPSRRLAPAVLHLRALDQGDLLLGAGLAPVPSSLDELFRVHAAGAAPAWLAGAAERLRPMARPTGLHVLKVADDEVVLLLFGWLPPAAEVDDALDLLVDLCRGRC